MNGYEDIVDFERSFVKWQINGYFTGRAGSDCVITKSKGPTSVNETYILGSGVLACHVLSNDEVFIKPMYLYQPLISEKEFRIFKHGPGVKDEFGQSGAKYDSLNVQVNRTPGRKLINEEDVIEAVERMAKISVKLAIVSLTGFNYTIEFPAKHVYYHSSSRRFQVEAGPVALPQDVKRMDLLETWRSCYVAFNTLDKIEYCVLDNPGINFRNNRFGALLSLQSSIGLYSSYEK